MQLIEITHQDGTKGKITQNQAFRISKMMYHDMRTPQQKYSHMSKKNKQYLHKAKKNIKMILQLDDLPQTQDQFKKLLYKNMPNFSWKQTQMLYEMIQAIIGMHYCKLDIEDQLE